MKFAFNKGQFYQVTAQFGEVDSVHHTAHSGIDLAMSYHTKLLSPTNGIVERVTDYGSHSIGKGVIIKTPDGNHLIFGHLSDNTEVHVGQHIHTGDMIGYSGNSGNSTGPHLHVGLEDNHGHFLDPSKYIHGVDQHSNEIISMAHHAPMYVNGLKVFSDAMHQFGHTFAEMSLHFVNYFAHVEVLSLISETIHMLLG